MNQEEINDDDDDGWFDRLIDRCNDHCTAETKQF